MQQFYILDQNQRLGPFDLVAMMKKIRNHRLKPGDMVLEEGEETPMRACELEALRPFFDEASKESTVAGPTRHNLDTLELMELLRYSWGEYERIQNASLYVGGLSLAIITLSLILNALLPATLVTLLAIALIGASLYVIILLVHFQKENRPVGPWLIPALNSARGYRLLLTGAVIAILCFAIPAMSLHYIGPLALLLLLPGCMVFGLFSLTPLIWLDAPDDTSVTSIALSGMQWHLAQDLDTIGKLLSITCLNLAALLCFFFPIFISLPVTFLALSEIYKSYYIHN